MWKVKSLMFDKDSYLRIVPDVECKSISVKVNQE